MCFRVSFNFEPMVVTFGFGKWHEAKEWLKYFSQRYEWTSKGLKAS